MNTRDEDYERVARRLDGDRIDLTEAQRLLAEEITTDAEKVGPALDVRLPGGVMHRVGARVKRAARVRRTARRWARWASTAAAVAAAAALVLMLLMPKPEQNGTTRLQPATNGKQFVDAASDEFDLRVELLDEELADYRARLDLDQDWPTDLTLTGVQEEIEDFPLDEDEPDTWFGQNGSQDSL